MARTDKGIMKTTLFIKNQKGISITEICVALCLVGIVAGVGLASFKKTMSRADMSSLCDSARLFEAGVNNCIKANGGWEVKRYSQTGDPACKTGETEPCQKVKPCKATTSTELKNKLNFNCPAGDCSAVATDDYFCLNMKKGKAQVIVHFDIDTREHKVYSGEPATFEAVTTATCIKSPTYTISKDEFCGTETEPTTGQTTTGKTSGGEQTQNTPQPPG